MYTTLPDCGRLVFFEEGEGNGANYKGSIDMKAELGRTQAKVSGSGNEMDPKAW